MLPEKENLDIRKSAEFLRDFEELYTLNNFNSEKVNQITMNIIMIMIKNTMN